MIAALLSIVGVAIALLAVLAAVFVGGLRLEWPPVVDLLRRMNRSLFAAQQLETAGLPGAYAGVVHHVGRRSGTSYATPVSIKRYGDDFVIALVYGRRSDWARNVLAAGEAVVDLEGATYQVTDPRIVPMTEVEAAFPPGDQRINRWMAIDECLRLRPSNPEAA